MDELTAPSRSRGCYEIGLLTGHRALERLLIPIYERPDAGEVVTASPSARVEAP